MPKVVKLRQENERLAGGTQLSQGVVLVSEHRQYKAQADLLQANLGYRLAWAEL